MNTQPWCSAGDANEEGGQSQLLGLVPHRTDTILASQGATPTTSPVSTLSMSKTSYHATPTAAPQQSQDTGGRNVPLPPTDHHIARGVSHFPSIVASDPLSPMHKLITVSYAFISERTEGLRQFEGRCLDGGRIGHPKVCPQAGGSDCRQGSKCPHLHVRREYCRAMRSLREGLCCAHHNDYLSRDLLRNDFFAAKLTGRSLTLRLKRRGIAKTMAPEDIMVTDGFEVWLRQAIESGDESLEVNHNLICEKHLQLAGGCPFMKQCKKLHFCRKHFAHVQSVCPAAPVYPPIDDLDAPLVTVSNTEALGMLIAVPQPHQPPPMQTLPQQIAQPMYYTPNVNRSPNMVLPTPQSCWVQQPPMNTTTSSTTVFLAPTAPHMVCGPPPPQPTLHLAPPGTPVLIAAPSSTQQPGHPPPPPQQHIVQCSSSGIQGPWPQDFPFFVALAPSTGSHSVYK